MNYEFYGISGSPNSWRAQFAMEVKGLSYTSHRLDPSKGEHKTPEHIGLNPHGKVPVLKSGSFIIYESIAIIAFLDQKHPEPPLLGNTTEQTGHIWQRTFEVMNYARDSINNGVVRPLIRGQAQRQGPSIQIAASQAHQDLKWVEALLGREPFLAGPTLSLADITYMPIIQGLIRAGGREDAAPLSLGFDDFTNQFPAISKWLNRIETTPGYDAAYPPHWRQPVTTD